MVLVAGGMLYTYMQCMQRPLEFAKTVSPELLLLWPSTFAHMRLDWRSTHEASTTLNQDPKECVE